jgi:transposase-like protein
MATKKTRTATKAPETKPESVPQKSTNFKQKLFIDSYLKNSSNISKACKEVGIDRKTYYNWMEDHNFADAFKEAEEEFLDSLENVFLEKVQQGDTACCIFAMKTRLKKRGYTEKDDPRDVKETLEFEVTN